MTLRGRRVVITGAGSGIGAASASYFAAAGADIVAVDINEEGAQATARSCAAHGVGAVAYTCDVADAAAMHALAAQIESEAGPVDVLINNAGVGMAGSFLEQGIDDWQWLRAINLDGVVNGCHAFGPAMVQRRRGQVVNVASMAAYMYNRDVASYCASKAGVMAFSQCLRADWVRAKVGVSVVCPGAVNTPITVRGSADAQARMSRATARARSPKPIAKAIGTAVERNRSIVIVGLEAHLAYYLTRMLPVSARGALARLSVR